jgi:hypothetical protein
MSVRLKIIAAIQRVAARQKVTLPPLDLTAAGKLARTDA